MSGAFPPPPPPGVPVAPAPPMQPGLLGAWAAPHRGATILTLGVVSLAINALSMIGGVAFAPCCFGTVLPIALAIPAWVMANTDLRLMQQGRMDPSGISNTSAGRVCAIISVVLSSIGIVLAIIGLIFGVVLLGAAAAAGGARP